MNKVMWLLIFVIFSFSCYSQTPNKNKQIGTIPVIFENLSQAQKDSFINTYKPLLNEHLLSYYDRFSSIKNGDTIFALLHDCKTESEKVIPFNFYVVNELSENSDGYLGDYIVDYFYNLFINHPGYIYYYLKVTKNQKFEKYEELLYRIMFNINGDQMNDNVLDSIFVSHKNKYPELKEIIDSVHVFILKNKEY